jgi:hypothetical protein
VAVHFENQRRAAFAFKDQGGVDRRQRLTVESDVHDRAANGYDPSNRLLGLHGAPRRHRDRERRRRQKRMSTLPYSAKLESESIPIAPNEREHKARDRALSIRGAAAQQFSF